MISTIHEATIVNTGWKDRKTNMEIKKSYAVIQYNKFKTHRQGRPVPQFLLGSEKHCKMVDQSGTVSAKLCTLQHVFCVQDTKYKQKSKLQERPAHGRKVLDISSPKLK
jgi:hypothetical protein